MSKEYEKIRQKIASKYNNEIKELKTEVKNLSSENMNLKSEIEQLKSELSSKDEWIERLLECSNMTKDDLEQLLEAEKDKKNAYQAIKVLASGIGRSGFIGMLNEAYGYTDTDMQIKTNE